jgi:hypothetical protein
MRARLALSIAIIGAAVGFIAVMDTRAGDSGPATTQPVVAPAAPADQAGRIVVARFVYEQGREETCFAEAFLVNADRESSVKVARHFAFVALSREEIFAFPFAVMTGSRACNLTAAEKKNLKAYLDRGGLLLASSSCSSQEWADSFRALLLELYPGQKLTPLGMDHPIFHRLYDIDRVVARKAVDAQPLIYGLEFGGRLAVVFSPLGLNDTDNAGPGCCCCGGNEIRNAQFINANVLIYALTR